MCSVYDQHDHRLGCSWERSNGQWSRKLCSGRSSNHDTLAGSGVQQSVIMDTWVEKSRQVKKWLWLEKVGSSKVGTCMHKCDSSMREHRVSPETGLVYTHTHVLYSFFQSSWAYKLFNFPSLFVFLFLRWCSTKKDTVAAAPVAAVSLNIIPKQKFRCLFAALERMFCSVCSIPYDDVGSPPLHCSHSHWCHDIEKSLEEKSLPSYI